MSNSPTRPPIAVPTPSSYAEQAERYLEWGADTDAGARAITAALLYIGAAIEAADRRQGRRHRHRRRDARRPAHQHRSHHRRRHNRASATVAAHDGPAAQAQGTKPVTREHATKTAPAQAGKHHAGAAYSQPSH